MPSPNMPVVGEIVHYWQGKAGPYAAIVCAIHEDTHVVDLAAFIDGTLQFVSQAPIGKDANGWTWKGDLPAVLAADAAADPQSP